MIVSEEEAKERLESPLNLLNRLRTGIGAKTSIPSLPPSSESIINDLEEKIAFGSIKSKAGAIMSEALSELKARLPEVTKPKELASIAETMNKVVTAQIAKNGDGDNKIAQVIIYAPQIINEEHYDVIDVSRSE